METEVKILQKKVTRLEETLKHLESETSRKITTILEQLISNRAEQVAAQKKVLENEEYFYQHLLSNCCWTSLKESDENETVQLETEINPDSILLQTLERGNLDPGLEIKINSTYGADQPEVSTAPAAVVQKKLQGDRSSSLQQTHQMNKRSSTRVDPLSILSLGYSTPSSTQRLDYQQSEPLADCSIESATHKLSENPNISMTLNPAPTSADYPNVEFQLQQQQFYGDSDLEEVVEMQTQDDRYPEVGQKSWDIDGTYNDNPPDLYQPTVIYTTPPSATLPQQPTGTGSSNKSRKPNKCKLCSAAFTLRRTLVMHMVTFHKSPQHQIQPLSNTQQHQDDQGKPQKRLFCRFPHCQKSYASTQNLKIHMRTHTGERPHICELCSKAFADPSCLRRHTMYFHGVGQNLVGN